jgi:hypothetical protein
VPGLLKFLVLVICLFFLRKLPPPPPPRANGGGGAPEGSSSTSIWELWPDIDKLDEINRGATSIGVLSGGTLREWSSSSSVARVNERASPVNKRALMDDALRPSSAPPRGHGRGSARNEAA